MAPCTLPSHTALVAEVTALAGAFNFYADRGDSYGAPLRRIVVRRDPATRTLLRRRVTLYPVGFMYHATVRHWGDGGEMHDVVGISPRFWIDKDRRLVQLDESGAPQPLILSELTDLHLHMLRHGLKNEFRAIIEEARDDLDDYIRQTASAT